MSDSSLANMTETFFTSYLENECGCSAHTIASYATACSLLFKFASQANNTTVEKLDIDHFSQRLLLNFLSNLETTRKNSAKTRNLRLAAIRTLFRFLASCNARWLGVCKQICAIRLKRTESSPPVSLSKEEVLAFLEAPDQDTLLGIRDRALFALLYAIGTRVSELVNLKVVDFQFHGSPQVKILGKGMKIRNLPLTESIVEAIKTYLKQREKAGISHTHLFLNYRGEPITRFGINAIIKSYHQRLIQTCPSLIGKTISPHSFRHTSALHLLIMKVDLAVIKDYLGHADISTTHHYTKINIEMKAEALNKLFPPLTDSKAEACHWKKTGMMAFLKRLQATA